MNSTQFQLTAAVYYSDFAREIIKTAAVSHCWLVFELETLKSNGLNINISFL